MKERMLTMEEVRATNIEGIQRWQDELTGSLVGLAKACGNNPKTEQTDGILIKGLAATMEYDPEMLTAMLKQVNDEKQRVSPGCSTCASPCGNTANFDMNEIRNDKERIRALKTAILYAVRGMAVQEVRAMGQGMENKSVIEFLYKALTLISYELEEEDLMKVVIEAGEVANK